MTTDPTITEDPAISGANDPIDQTVRITAVRAPMARRPTELTVHVVGGRDFLRFACLRPGEALLIGRDEQANLQLTDHTVSKRHARLTCPEPDVIVIEDLGSTNGTHVNGHRVSRSMLKPDDQFEVGTVLLRIDSLTVEQLAHQKHVMERLETADCDPLTGLLTRTFLDAELTALVARVRNAGQPISCAFADVDRFKDINDSLGHQVGDEVLLGIARLLMHGVRDGDPCVRYGGEEILLFLPGTGVSDATDVSNRIRRSVAGHEWGRTAPGLAVTVSFGVAQLEPQEEVRSWLRRADEALYRAKQSGRNRVERA